MRPGYKQTPIGVLPEDWDLVPFADLFEFRNGVNAEKAAYGQGVPFINVLEPITYAHIRGPEITGKVTLPPAIISEYAVRRGDILLNRTSETQEEVGLASAYVGTGLVVFGGFVIRARPVQHHLDPIYSGYALRAPAIRAQIIPMGQGAVRANISQDNLRLVLAPIPSLPEQRAIAGALSDVDALLAALERAIAKKRNLRLGAMQQLLTGRTRLVGFEGEWEVKRLGDIATCYSGGTPATSIRSYYAGAIPWITSSDLNRRYIDDVPGRISEEGFKNSAAKMIPPNCLIVAMYGATAGVAAISRISAAINQAVLSIIPHEDDTTFLFLMLSHLKEKIIGTYTQGGQPNLNGQIIKSIKLLVPQPEEQRAVAAVLSDMDAEIAALEQRRDKTRALKQAMMQELLTGKTRLVPPEGRPCQSNPAPND